MLYFFILSLLYFVSFLIFKFTFFGAFVLFILVILFIGFSLGKIFGAVHTFQLLKQYLISLYNATKKAKSKKQIQEVIKESMRNMKIEQ